MPPKPGQRPDEEERRPATHRLRRMMVQEVSLVDAAANGRQFLIAKKAAPMNVKVKKETAAAATATVAEEAGAAADTANVGSMQAQVKEELTSLLADAAEKIIAIATQIDGMPVTDQPATPAVPADVTAQITALAQSLSETSAKFGGGAAVAASEEGEQPAPNGDAEKMSDDDEEEATDAEKAAVVAATAEVTAKGLDPAKHPDLVAKSVGVRLKIDGAAIATAVRKAGRRMAKERLERLGKAIDLLIGILKELRYDSERKAAANAKAREAKASATKKSDTPTFSIEDVRGIVEATDALVAEHGSVVAKATATDAELRAAKTRIAELEKRTGVSMVLAPEAHPKMNGGHASENFWPADMNDLIDRPATARRR